MLCQLSIKNIALVEDLTIEFTPGLNVLTGETGAGKSIVIDSLNLALGERADRDLIRAGEQKASVQALFDVSENEEALQALQQEGVETEGGDLIVSRELSVQGKNVVRMNGVLLPLAKLKQISMLLVDVHGQHEHQSLLDEDKHLGFLDQYAVAEVAAPLAKVRQTYEDWHAKQARLNKIITNAQQRAQRLDMLEYQADEIEKAHLVPDEEEKLKAKQSMYKNAGKIAESLSKAVACLEGGDEGLSVLDALRVASQEVSAATRYLPELSPQEEAINDALFTVEDVRAQLSDRLESLDFNEREAERVENRLDEIKNLKRKYGESIPAILKYLDAISEEITALKRDEKDSGALEKEVLDARQQLLQAENALSEKRREAAKRFEQALLVQLKDLGMASATFTVEFSPLPQEENALAAASTPHGYDAVRFLLSANKGEPLKPLAKTASGGELSRIMLAFKTICAGAVDTMVFDEIDTGISGKMAQVVGEKLSGIGGEKQVICVTHSAQIAALGTSHHLVSKAVEQERTKTNVELLQQEERIREIARIIGGRTITNAAVENAREMLAQAQEYLRKR